MQPLTSMLDLKLKRVLVIFYSGDWLYNSNTLAVFPQYVKMSHFVTMFIIMWCRCATLGLMSY